MIVGHLPGNHWFSTSFYLAANPQALVVTGSKSRAPGEVPMYHSYPLVN